VAQMKSETGGGDICLNNWCAKHNSFVSELNMQSSQTSGCQLKCWPFALKC